MKMVVILTSNFLDCQGYAIYNSEQGSPDLMPLSLLVQVALNPLVLFSQKKASGTSLSSIVDNGGLFRVMVVYGNCHDLIFNKDTGSLAKFQRRLI